MIKPKEQWINESKLIKKQIFFFEDKVLDLTNFQQIHPGGKKALTNYVYKDITDTVFTVYPHKKGPTISKLLSFVIGKIPKEDIKQTRKIQRSLTPLRDKKKVCFVKNFVQVEKNIKEQPEKQPSLNFDSNKQNLTKNKKKDKFKRIDSSKSIEKRKSKSRKRTEKKLSIKKSQPPAISPEFEAYQSIRTLTEDLDEEKPSFRVPILTVKHMGNCS